MEVFRYQQADGHEPFTEWLNTIKDKLAQARIRKRLLQIQTGNFGDAVSVGSGVVELRVHVGTGYRVYCCMHGRTVVLLLCGGDKGSQSGDIRRAKALWEQWKQRQR